MLVRFCGSQASRIEETLCRPIPIALVTMVALSAIVMIATFITIVQGKTFSWGAIQLDFAETIAGFAVSYICTLVFLMFTQSYLEDQEVKIREQSSE